MCFMASSRGSGHLYQRPPSPDIHEGYRRILSCHLHYFVFYLLFLPSLRVLRDIIGVVATKQNNEANGNWFESHYLNFIARA